MPPNYILENVAVFHLPGFIVQGRHDVICPPLFAYALSQAWGKNAQTIFVDDAGHSAFEAGILEHLIHALKSLSNMIKG